MSLLNTVANNKLFFTKSQIKNAETTRYLQQCIRWTSCNAFKICLSNNMINNSKVGMDDIQRSITIYGFPEPLLSGKMTGPSQTQFINSQVRLPIEILQQHKYLQLFMDVFYVNRILFLITKTSKINCITPSHLKNRSKELIIKAINIIKRTYLTRGF